MSEYEMNQHNTPLDHKEELSRLREELKDRDRVLKDSEARYDAVEQRLQGILEKLGDVERANQETTYNLQEENMHWRGRALRAEEDLTNALKQQETDANHFSQKIHNAEHNVQELQEQLSMSRDNLESSRKLLSERTDELKMVENFVSRMNSLSGRELIEIVEELNQEISQMASTMMDALEFEEPHRKMVSDEEFHRLQAIIVDSLPHPFLLGLARHLPVFDDADEDLGIQTGLQDLLAHAAFYYAYSWCPSSTELGQLLEQIYKKIRAADHFSAPRWRAMTRAQLRQRSYQDDVRFIDTALRNHTARLLNLCGWTNEYLESNERHSQAIVRGIEIITAKILQLNKAIAEDMIQDEATIIWLRAGSGFNRELAIDDFSVSSDDRALASRNSVLFTTELGLQIITPRSGGNIITTPLKAKVIMNDTIRM